MNFTSKQNGDTERHSRYLFAAAVLLFSLFAKAPCAQAGSEGLSGFATCATLDATSQYYMAGDPVYISERFHVSGESPNYQQAFANFLKQKYGWTKSVSCWVSFNSDGATKSFNEHVKQAGQKLVRTGWTPASAGSSAAPNPAPGAPDVTSSATSRQYWVCHSVGANTLYLSGVINRDNPVTSPAFTSAFSKFLEARYNLKNAGATCLVNGTEAAARRVLNNFAAANHGAVQTGWIYGKQPTP